MRVDDIKRLLHEQPFRPFRIHLSNGRTHEIRHPELAMLGRTTMIVGKQAPDLPEPAYDDFAIVTLMHINEVEPLPIPNPTSTNGTNS